MGQSLSAQVEIKAYPIEGLNCTQQNTQQLAKGEDWLYIDNKAEWQRSFPDCRLSVFDWNNFSIIVVNTTASGCSTPMVTLGIINDKQAKTWTPNVEVKQYGLCRMAFQVQKFFFVQKMPVGYRLNDQNSGVKIKPLKTPNPDLIEPYFKTDKQQYAPGDSVKVSYYNEQEPILNSNFGGCGGGPYYMVICHNDSTQNFGSVHSCDYLITTYNYQPSCELNFVVSIPGTYSVQFFLGPIGLLNDETRFSRPIYSGKFEVK